MKISKYYLGYLFILSFIGFSCSKSALDKVNFDRNNPQNVSAKFILTDAITSTAFNVVGGDASLYSSIYVEHEGGDYEQLYNAEMRQVDPTQSSTYDNEWGSIYQNIKALKIAVQKTSPGGEEEGNDITCGIAKILLAYNLAVLTDLYGDVPYSQTGIMNSNGTPKYLNPVLDKQSDLYPQIFSMLDSAITLLGGSDNAATGGIGSQDLIYGGKASSWKKVAYGLKARYLMRTLKVSQHADADLDSIVSYTNKSFGSSDEEFKFTQYDATSNYNPLDAFSESREGDLGASKSLAQKFQQTNDPRGAYCFSDWDGNILSIGDAIDQAIPNGQLAQPEQYGYAFSVIDFTGSAPTELLSYHEVLFLQAEALVRLGKTDDALPILKAAIEDAYDNLSNSLNLANDYFGFGATMDLSESDADNYFKNSVTPRFNANPLKEVLLQKYLAFYGASGESLESYNDYRRLLALGQADFIGLQNPLNAKPEFPLRFAYGNSDVTTNPNVEAAYKVVSVYTNPVWWAGGNN